MAAVRQRPVDAVRLQLLEDVPLVRVVVAAEVGELRLVQTREDRLLRVVLGEIQPDRRKLAVVETPDPVCLELERQHLRRRRAGRRVSDRRVAPRRLVVLVAANTLDVQRERDREGLVALEELGERDGVVRGAVGLIRLRLFHRALLFLGSGRLHGAQRGAEAEQRGHHPQPPLTGSMLDHEFSRADEIERKQISTAVRPRPCACRRRVAAAPAAHRGRSSSWEVPRNRSP